MVQGAGLESPRVNGVIIELQRQVEDERRKVHRQFENLERRLQQQSLPFVGNERWANLQGSVTALHEDMTMLSRRVETLDERLRLRSGKTEDLLWGKTRDLQEQLHMQQQKLVLAVATSEEMSKRQTTRIRRLVQSIEHRFDNLPTRPIEGSFDARLRELEGQQVSLEDEFHSFAKATATAQEGVTQATLRRSMEGGSDGTHCTCSRGKNGHDSMLRVLECDLANLAQETKSQLDDHTKALASLRVRMDGREERLVATSERLETVVAPPIQALRTELSQLRDRDRHEFESRLRPLSERLQEIASISEETTTELRDKLKEVDNEFQLLKFRPQEQPWLRNINESLASQEQVLRRHTVILNEPQRNPPMLPGALCGALMRVETLERRLECFEQGGFEDKLATKAEHVELLRVNAGVHELWEPLRRLTQRATNTEARTAALEHQVEQLKARPVDRDPGSPVPSDIVGANAQTDVMAKELVNLTARIIDLESILENDHSPKDKHTEWGHVSCVWK